MSIATPSEHRPLLLVWSTFEIFAGCSNVILLAITLASQRAKANPILLNLEIIFILASFTSSVLIWTGHAMDRNPPYELCLMNAAFIMYSVPLMATGALSIVLKVWGSVMIACHPNWSPAMRWITQTPVLILFPHFCALPLLAAGLLIGIDHPGLVSRGSPFYCTVNVPAIQTATSCFGAIYTMICLILASWTTYMLITTRWRVRRVIEYPDVSYSFVCRVLFFSIFVGVAFVVGIVSLLSDFAAIVPDVVLSSCGVASFFIFGTSKPILQFLFHCQRTPSTQSTPPTITSSTPSLLRPLPEVPRELFRLSIRELTTSTGKTYSTDDHPLWQMKDPGMPDEESSMGLPEEGVIRHSIRTVI